MSDQAKYTDEGWWASAAVSHRLLGDWYVPGDYNPGVALPVWPVLVDGVFRVTGVSLVAARTLSVAFSVATVGLVFWLARRYSETHSKLAGAVAALLLAASPMAFVFSRLAILESAIGFEFCLVLVVASLAGKRLWLLPALPLLAAVMLLTKTTSAVLLPAVCWLAWSSLAEKIGSKSLRMLAAGLLAAAIPVGLWKGYEAAVMHSRYAVDYQYFFENSAMPEIAWDKSVATVLEMLRNCFWVDRILYPLGVCGLVWSVAWRRALWRNPLWTASWLAIAGEAALIFARQDDYAPRYFLGMLVPLVLAVILAIEQLFLVSSRALVVGGMALVAAVLLNVTQIVSLVAHRTYAFVNAASSIQRIVESSSPVADGRRQLILGISGSQISLMTGIPSISDGYGTEEMPAKLDGYRPGWYVAWNHAIDSTTTSLYELRPVASYAVFDDPDRDRLVLYAMTPKPAHAAAQK